MKELDIVGMAWADKISFEEIKKKTGFAEKEIVAIMRRTLKKIAIFYGENGSEVG